MPEESTTPDLVELTRRTLDFFGDGPIDAVTPFFAPDAVWDLSDAGIGVHEGADAVRRFIEDWTGSFEHFAIEVQEVLDLGHGVVLLAYRDSGRPLGSIRETQQRHAAVIVWEAGKVARQTNYMDIDQARAVAERLAEEWM